MSDNPLLNLNPDDLAGMSLQNLESLEQVFSKGLIIEDRSFNVTPAAMFIFGTLKLNIEKIKITSLDTVKALFFYL